MMQFGYHPVRPAQSGYRVQYRVDEINHCPGCGNAHWHIGRMTAECAFCGTAVPICTGGSSGVGLFRTSGNPADIPLAA